MNRDVQVGDIYVNENNEYSEKYIIKVISKTDIGFLTETLYIHSQNEILVTEWLPQFFKRPANEQEINLFNYYRARCVKVEKWSAAIAGL